MLILRTLNTWAKKLRRIFGSQHSKTVVNVVKQLSGYNDQENTFITPSVVFKIGHPILQCADIMESKLITKNETEDKLQQIRNFTKVFQK